MAIAVYGYQGAAVAQLVARWAADLQVERSILCLGGVSSKKFAYYPRLLPAQIYSLSVQTGPKAAFIIHMHSLI